MNHKHDWHFVGKVIGLAFRNYPEDGVMNYLRHPDTYEFICMCGKVKIIEVSNE